MPLRPGRDVLYTTQNRQREKEFLRRSGFPVAPFCVVESENELRAAVAKLGFPCVLKTADFGYDGKGQQKLSSGADLGDVWRRHGERAGVIEAWISFAAELSVVVARGHATEPGDYAVQAFPPTLNEHENHILATSVAPAPLADSILARAQSIASDIANAAGRHRSAGRRIFSHPARGPSRQRNWRRARTTRGILASMPA